ncbi:MAG: GHKL domain-containing protein, partial [Pseudomonadales bacterium]|nr:GHKL domain-containing protein [Pseudomonadales bacterium]
VCDASERMGHIIDGLLMLSQSTQSSLQWDEVDLSELVNEKVRWLRNLEPNRTVVIEIQKNCITHGDVQLLHQVIDNLLSNAWKYSHKNPQAQIEFGQQETERNPNTYFVRDNGAGFDAENASDLFKPFRRFHTASDFEGTGIGLATVSRIVKRHGGEIWVNSEAGKGAIFYFTLSQADDHALDPNTLDPNTLTSNANNQDGENQSKYS